MASAVIHIAVAKEINKKLKMNEKELFLGTIAPDISKQLGQSKTTSHFLTDNSDCPNLDLFISKYKSQLNTPFIMGYYIHLFTDYLWFKYFMSEIKIDNKYIYDENGKSITNDKDKLKNIIYNDYTNLNILLIEEYNLDLSLFYEAFTPLKLDFKEIPLDKLNIIIDKMGIIIENSKKEKTYSFNLENVKRFINTSTDIILSSIKEIIK